MSLTRKQQTNHEGFPKPRELIEITGAHELEAQDRALLNVLFQHAHDSGRLIEPDAEWSLPFASVRQMWSRHESNDRFRQSLRRLLRVIVSVPCVNAETGEPEILETHLLDFVQRTANLNSPNAIVKFGIPKKLQPILAHSDKWGRIQAEVVCAMSSKYAVSLYEIVQARRNMENFVECFAIAKFRGLLGVPPGTYEQGSHFRTKVIEPALLEVNGLSDMNVSIELRRKHPKAPIEEVSLAWRKKSFDEYRAAVAERNRAKVGRMARLRGNVEQVEPVGPRLPSAADHAELDAMLEKSRAAERAKLAAE